MSTETQATEQAAGTDAAAKATGPSAVVLAAVVAVAAMAGVAGGFVLGPRLAPTGVAAVEAEEASGHGSEGGGKIFRLDNLIVNPAGSEGTRFLMASVAFEVESAEQEAKLRERDVQVRDLVISKLEGQTMANLTQPFARDTLKRQLAEAVSVVLGPRARVQVYLPQFVIQ